ncbi:MAG: hypothetical protein QME66_13670 [Candidatus Eisenbacteria bacterium]|nr:hypothetical protein [Candidatus Eisenbacteria bacterium]
MARTSANRIKDQQLAWAQRSGIALDSDDYCVEREKNLFESLCPCSIREIVDSDGAELGKGGQRGKMQAVYSSSALLCNIFDYWRGRDLSLIAEALGISGRCCGLAFEQKFPTGLGRIPPNIDVVLCGRDGAIFAVEGKFMEPYRRSKAKNYLKPKYFADATRFWANRGLPGCQRVAEDLRDGKVVFEFLDAAQLLKHMLGLSANCQTWRLCYLWFRPDGAEAHSHAQEIAHFSGLLGADAAHFVSYSYQEFFSSLAKRLGEEHRTYVEYLRDRYFGETVT